MSLDYSWCSQIIFTSQKNICEQKLTTTITIVLRPLDCVRDYPDERHQKGETRKVKPIWIYWSKREWQWHQLGHMQICTLAQTDNHGSISSLSFLQARCHSCHPTNSIKALKAKTEVKKIQLTVKEHYRLILNLNGTV